MNETQELINRLKNSEPQQEKSETKYVDFFEEDLHEKFTNKLVQWASSDGNVFFASASTTDKLVPGAYQICSSPQGVFFNKVQIKTEGLLRFDDANSDKVIKEIRKFWASKAKYQEFGIVYKRGICLWGPPGSGKSSCIRFIMNDVIKMGGIVVEFTNPKLFEAGMQQLRQIQPEVPVVCTMEDLDSILETYSESEILNILDGYTKIDNIVFLATTNYPEKLGARIINRPSRFDKRFKIGMPSAADRLSYLKYLFGDKDFTKYDLAKWVKDTEDFSMAHLKELFTVMVILENDYKDAILTLRTMVEPVSKEFNDNEDDELLSIKADPINTRRRGTRKTGLSGFTTQEGV